MKMIGGCKDVGWYSKDEIKCSGNTSVLYPLIGASHIFVIIRVKTASVGGETKRGEYDVTEHDPM